MRKREHSVGSLTLAQPGSILSDLGLNGTICSILSRGGNAPLTSASSRTLLGVLSSVLNITFERDVNKLECTPVADEVGRNRRQSKMLRSWEAIVYSSKLPRAVVRLIEHRNYLCSQYFSGQSE